jgi:hypothetical protein
VSLGTTNGDVFRVLDSGAGAQVNILTATGGATGQSVGLTCGGPLADPNVGCVLGSKGNGFIRLTQGVAISFQVETAPASPVNRIDVLAAATGNPPQILAVGSDTNVNLEFNPQGTGVLQFKATPGVNCSTGTVNATTLVVTGGLVTHC